MRIEEVLIGAFNELIYQVVGRVVELALGQRCEFEGVVDTSHEHRWKSIDGAQGSRSVP